jgi:hypothetical protein
MSDDRFSGFARCTNPACIEIDDTGQQVGGQFDVDRPVDLVRETVAQKGYPGEAFASMVITESSYVHPVDDADLLCPDCGRPCAVIDKVPVSYPKAVVG